MRSPWKVIAGLVSRRDSEISDELAGEISETSDPRAEKPHAEIVARPQVIALQNPSSAKHTADPAESKAPTGSDEQTRERDEGIIAVKEVLSRPPLTKDIEPVLATTIRLITSDRLSVGAAVPASTAVPDALEADHHDVPVAVQTDLGEKTTEHTAAAINAAEPDSNAEGKASTTPAERAVRNRPRRSAPIVERPLSKPLLAEPIEARLVGDVVSTEALNLESEIAQLRYQLAKKLRLQNEQLKQLLARYDDKGL